MKRRTRVKICGITRLADALVAIEAGADALGFVFHPASPRWIAPAAARAIAAQLPPLVSTVGLFVNADWPFVTQVCAEVGLDLVQFHGQESADYCAQCTRPYVKAVAAAPNFDYAASAREFAGARALLVDTYHPQLAGGTGTCFDWSVLPNARSKPLILAGGLTAANVGQAITQIRPYAVDVSGGVESSKGIKDATKIREFIAEVTRVECYESS